MNLRVSLHAREQLGLTLIEMMVAILIFAIISVLAYQSFDGLLRARDRQISIQQENNELYRALAVLQQDLIHLRPRPYRDQFGDQHAAYQAPTPVYDVEFVRGGLPPVSGIEGGLQRVGYRVENDGRLSRNVWPVTDPNVNTNPMQQFLLSDVRDFEVEQLDSLNFWVPTWPPLNQNLPKDQLPRMIRITLSMDDGETITRMIPGVEYVEETES